MSNSGRIMVLIAGFLGWLFAGFQLATTSLVVRDAAKNLLGEADEGVLGSWSGWLIASFMLGAALGGYLFGWVGDKFGRRNAMAFSIICYCSFVGITYFAQDAWQLLILRFLTGLGVGGMWPNAISLVSEAWPNISRPFLAGVIGTAANVGIMSFALIACFIDITPDAWRWTMIVGACPIVLAVFVFTAVPESPEWLALKQGKPTEKEEMSPLVEVFRPPILAITIVGILLGTVPLFGGWGSSNWAIVWASKEGDASSQEQVANDNGESNAKKAADPSLKAKASLARSSLGSISSLLGGGLAVLMGRRICYFFLSAACLFCSQYLFRYSHPMDPSFLWWTGALGLFSGFFFGWLPFCLPQLFPTRVRSTGAGLSFNFGRILTVVGILVAAGMLKDVFDGDYAKIGQLTSWIYAGGLILAFLIPRTQDEKDQQNSPS